VPHDSARCVLAHHGMKTPCVPIYVFIIIIIIIIIIIVSYVAVKCACARVCTSSAAVRYDLRQRNDDISTDVLDFSALSWDAQQHQGVHEDPRCSQVSRGTSHRLCRVHLVTVERHWNNKGYLRSIKAWQCTFDINSTSKRSAPYWSHPPFLIFLTLSHSGAQALNALVDSFCQSQKKCGTETVVCTVMTQRTNYVQIGSTVSHRVLNVYCTHAHYSQEVENNSSESSHI